MRQHFTPDDSIPPVLRRLLLQIESDQSLLDLTHVKGRLEALHSLELYIGTFPELPYECMQRAFELRDRLEKVNSEFYSVVRKEIRAGVRPPILLRWMDEMQSARRGAEFDYLDEVVSDILQFEAPADMTVTRCPEKLFYQPTPVRHILDLLRLTSFAEDDLLMDLGSGLGHVAMLASLCTRARAVGVEVEQPYTVCAEQAARALHLDGVSFLNQDAREADLSPGTVFYLYTPFMGATLRHVLERLHCEAIKRPIRIASYGPCTPAIAVESWLTARSRVDPEAITIFHSRI